MQTDQTLEFNFDGLVGPTHNYAGLAPGNLASQSNKARASSPRAAALQGLAKMDRLRALGVPQAVLPPQERPNVVLLRRLGFAGSDEVVLASALREAPHLLAAAGSSSSMWAANAATVCPSADAADGRVHFTPANLATSLHRTSETATTAAILQAVFDDPAYFVHHTPLPGMADFGDEGAANHTRFCSTFGEPAVQLFVYGRNDFAGLSRRPQRFPARQSRQACEAVARLHQLAPDRTLFALQHPDAIDAGVFHNDVIAVGHRDVLLCHETAFADQPQTLDALRCATSGRLRTAVAPANRISLGDAVSSYLFNSQIVTRPDGGNVLVAPAECEQHPVVAALIAEWVNDGILGGVEFVDVHQSMRNGGGPACLRLRVVLTPDEQRAVAPGVILDDHLSSRLAGWIERHYRDHLEPADLADPDLLCECREALDELTRILGLVNLYEFQGGDTKSLIPMSNQER
ncbi:MAG: N-succinylarginine dihydrolase [Planctomycetota bacterium]